MGLLWSRIADGGPRFGGKPREGFLRGGTGNPMLGPNPQCAQGDTIAST